MSWPDDPIAAVVHPDPYPYYAALAAEPMRRHERLGLLVAARTADVVAVLASDRLRVRPPAEPVPRAIADGAAGEVFGRLVRMTDGPRQADGKRAVRGGALVGRSARGPSERSRTRRPSGRVSRSRAPALARDGGRLARARTDDGGPRRPASRTTARRPRSGRGCSSPASRRPRRRTTRRRARAPRRGSATRSRAPACTARSRARRRRPGSTRPGSPRTPSASCRRRSRRRPGSSATPSWPPDDHPRGSEEPVDALVRHVLLHDPPVHNTRRFVAEPGTVADVPVAPGDAILVVLAAAALPFGAGGHACPGDALAAALAAGTLEAPAGRRPRPGLAGAARAVPPVSERAHPGVRGRRTGMTDDRAARFRALHDGPEVLVLPNAVGRPHRPRVRGRRLSRGRHDQLRHRAGRTACATARTKPGTRRWRPSRGWRRRCACRSRSTWRAGSAARRTTSRGARAALADAGAAGFNLEDGRDDGTLRGRGPPARPDRRGARRPCRTRS